MPRRRVHAGLILVGFVIASGLAMACLIFAALSVGGHHADTADASASTTPTTSMPPATSSAAPEPSSAPKTSGARATVTIAPLPPLAAASSAKPAPPKPAPPKPAPTPTNNGADHHDAPAQVAAGDCVGGIGSSGSVTETSCGSSDSAYRVNSTSGQCPSDSDRTVSQTQPGESTKTLCLDTDWEVGRCMTVSGNTATPADCAAPVPGTMRVQSINRGTANVNTCTDSNHGVVYKQRRFVVCLAQM